MAEQETEPALIREARFTRAEREAEQRIELQASILSLSQKIVSLLNQEGEIKTEGMFRRRMWIKSIPLAQDSSLKIRVEGELDSDNCYTGDFRINLFRVGKNSKRYQKRLSIETECRDPCEEDTPRPQAEEVSYKLGGFWPSFQEITSIGQLKPWLELLEFIQKPPFVHLGGGLDRTPWEFKRVSG